MVVRGNNGKKNSEMREREKVKRELELCNGKGRGRREERTGVGEIVCAR